MDEAARRSGTERIITLQCKGAILSTVTNIPSLNESMHLCIDRETCVRQVVEALMIQSQTQEMEIHALITTREAFINKCTGKYE